MTTSKSDLRRRVREAESALSPEELRESGETIIARVSALPEYIRAKTVMLFVGVGTEPDTRGLTAAALEAGKTVALPKITGPGTMEARAVTSPDGLVPGPFRIPEPPDEAPLVPPESLDLILVPGAAFTPDGRRLGRGGGYYDRYLPRSPALRVGLARGVCVLDDIPTAAHDARVDLVVTDR